MLAALLALTALACALGCAPEAAPTPEALRTNAAQAPAALSAPMQAAVTASAAETASANEAATGEPTACDPALTSCAASDAAPAPDARADRDDPSAHNPAPAAPPLGPEAALGRDLALGVVSSARAVDKRARLLRMPAAVFGATQRVHRAAYAGSIWGTWAPAGGEVSEKAKARALRRRRTLKPGELEVVYTKTGERLKVQLYNERGVMRPEAYTKLCEALYDPNKAQWGNPGPWVAYHPRLFALLYHTAQYFDRPLELVSGYRHPKPTSKSRSYHVRGRAMDFRVRGKKRQNVLGFVEAAFSGVGVGWYPNSTFIHLDARDKSYYWTDPSKPGQRSRHIKRAITRKPRHGKDPTAETIHVRVEHLYNPKLAYAGGSSKLRGKRRGKKKGRRGKRKR